MTLDDVLALLVGLETRTIEVGRSLEIESTSDQSQSGKFDTASY